MVDLILGEDIYEDDYLVDFLRKLDAQDYYFLYIDNVEDSRSILPPLFIVGGLCWRELI